MSTRGLLLAAGAGRRMGTPKALVRDPDGTSWLLRSIASLRPCAGVTVVLGAEAERAARLLPPSVDLVVAGDWEQGMGASLRAGLGGIDEEYDAALVSLVDLPDVTSAVVARVLGGASGPGALARATYGGTPGHPVLLGRDHWAGVTEVADGDKGARDYLTTAAATGGLIAVECGDLATGEDVDRPPAGEGGPA